MPSNTIEYHPTNTVKYQNTIEYNWIPCKPSHSCQCGWSRFVRMCLYRPHFLVNLIQGSDLLTWRHLRNGKAKFEQTSLSGSPINLIRAVSKLITYVAALTEWKGWFATNFHVSLEPQVEQSPTSSQCLDFSFSPLWPYLAAPPSRFSTWNLLKRDCLSTSQELSPNILRSEYIGYWKLYNFLMCCSQMSSGSQLLLCLPHWTFCPPVSSLHRLLVPPATDHQQSWHLSGALSFPLSFWQLPFHSLADQCW